MYLADTDLHALLEHMEVLTDDPNHPFNADEQVQPSSIDLRLSNVFWQPSHRALLRRRVGRRRALDLRRSDLEELHPRRDWRKLVLKDGQSVTLKPGRVLMARIYERFDLPANYAGKIEGRSSFARLGLMVHCTGDYINPGWGGYMPLQLYNAGPFALRLCPYLPICQLMLVSLSSVPARTYGDPALQSKYMNDDGGPSYWWRDLRIKRLQRHMAQANVSLAIREEIVRLVRFEDPDLLEHFESFVLSRREGQLESADAILEAFAVREDRRRPIDRLSKWLPPFLLAASLGAFFERPIGGWHVLLWALTVVACVWSLYVWFSRPAEYLGHKELARARSDAEREERPTGGA